MAGGSAVGAVTVTVLAAAAAAGRPARARSSGPAGGRPECLASPVSAALSLRPPGAAAARAWAYAAAARRRASASGRALLTESVAA